MKNAHSDGHTTYRRPDIRTITQARPLHPRSTSEHHARFLYLSGRALLKHGPLDIALALLAHAASLSPSTARYYQALGDAFAMSGRDSDAVSAHLREITLNQCDSGPYRRLGRVLYRQRRLAEALAAYRQAFRLAPLDADICRDLGDTLCAMDRPNDAVDYFQRQLELAPDDVEGHIRLGRVQYSLGWYEPAFENFRRALDRQPDNFAEQLSIGETLIRLGRLENAVDAFRAALGIKPNDLGASRRLVWALEASGNTRDAAGAWLTLGHALHTVMQYEAAGAAYRKALAYKRDCSGALLGLGRVQLALGEPEQAIVHLQSALSIRPAHSRTHFGLGDAYQYMNDSVHGWQEYAWSYGFQDSPADEYGQPTWDGTPLNGRPILLWTEHGRGDTIQFLRYIKVATDLGGHAMVLCHHRGLLPLIRRMNGVERVFGTGEPLPAFDVHAPLARLPALFQTNDVLRRVAVPYLSVDAHAKNAWRERLGASGILRVGICWKGNTGHRSAPLRFIPLDQFGRLSDLTGIRFISLQYPADRTELMTAPPGLHVEQLFGSFFPIADAAALISNLDLVVTVDTMVAHLAGALGMPVWTLLPKVASWRWRLEGEETPWYPTMRLFRQPRRGDWLAVFEGVRSALVGLLGQPTSIRCASPEREDA